MRRTDLFYQTCFDKGKELPVEYREKLRWFGIAAVVCVLTAGLLQLLAKPAAIWFSDPKVASFVIYLETGRVVKDPFRVTQPPEPPVTEPAVTVPPPESVEPPLTQAVFQPSDTELIQISDQCGYNVDMEAMLLTELSWNLKESQPKVLILHSHTTESYTQTPLASYKPSGDYRTLDAECNMLRVGRALKEALEHSGIAVIHDTKLHDHPSYNDSYINSRESVAAYLKAYPGISLVVDLHRDAVATSNNKQLDTHAWVNGQESAQLMLVVGSDAGGRNHPAWRENMALAVKLHAQLEKLYPGLCRPISFRSERFNQDLSAGALLIEVGAAGNTLEEALMAVEALACGIAALAGGTVTADSTS